MLQGNYVYLFCIYSEQKINFIPDKINELLFFLKGWNVFTAR